MKKRKTWNVIGIVLGIMIIIVGIYFIATPADHYITQGASNHTFGADYYTYEYEATKIIATNTAVTANNLREIGEKISQYAGAFFVVIGLLTIIHYAEHFFCDDTLPDSSRIILTEKNEENSNDMNEVDVESQAVKPLEDERN